MFCVLFVLSVLFSVCSAQRTPQPQGPSINVLCDVCNNGLSLVQTQLVALESITKNNLGTVVNTLCRAAPTDVPIINALCTVLKDNLVGALVTLVQGLKEQTKPELLCRYFKVCDNNSRV